MNDENQSRQENSCDDEPSLESIGKDSARQSQTGTHVHPSKSFLQQWRELSLDRKIESVIGAVGLTVAIVLAYTAVNQLDAMQEQTAAMKSQLAEMKSGGVETGKLIAATEKIAEATSTGVVQSKTALDATIEASRLGQRAWVGPANMKMMTFEAGKPIRVEVVFTNTGHSPALKAKGFLFIRIRESPIDIGNFNLDEMAKSLKDRPSISTVFPNGALSLQTEPIGPATEKYINEVKAGRLEILILGKVTYLDIFQNTHISTVCAKYEPVGKGFAYCDQHNYSN